MFAIFIRDTGEGEPLGDATGDSRMTESEQKGYELQMRVYKVRGVLPFRMMLRVFREPGECVETWDVVG
ncbi:MAG: hypothetical protein NXY57DRAFT_1018884 [Lentinula lateritia]|nr:MAG: hypothetical protein NXY57DRAFT_1018884 [Lentinula lateritia]